MLIRILAAAFLFLTLTGCILQSRKPIFSDEQGELILAPYGSRFESYSIDGGNWKKDEETISFTPANRHYVASDGKSDFTVTFAAIGGTWWAMQGQEKGNPANYYLADTQKGEVFFYPLTCKQLQDTAKFGDFIEFKGDDCFVKDGADTAAMFKALAAEPRQPGLKLVPLP